MNLEQINMNRIPVLDHGFVRLVEVMGSDERIEEAARLTAGTSRSRSDRRGLIRYLIRKDHGTPFEFAEVTFDVQVPMDTWRQWVRHRTLNINEYSTRYSEAIDAAAATPPYGWRRQATANRQGSAGLVTEWPEGARPTDRMGRPEFTSPGHYLSVMEEYIHQKTRQVYEERLRFGVAREQARKDLPLSTYTRAYVKCDLRNWFHFLALRSTPDELPTHAQIEIRAYADVIGSLIENLFPISYEAFRDFRLNALRLSAVEIQVMRSFTLARDKGLDHEAAFASSLPADWLPLANKSTEREECWEKLIYMGLLPDPIDDDETAGRAVVQGEGEPR